MFEIDVKLDVIIFELNILQQLKLLIFKLQDCNIIGW